MHNFTFYNPVKIIFGEGSVAKIAEELSDTTTKVLITYGGGSVKQNGIFDQVSKALKDCVVFEFGGIEPNPKYETLMEAVQLCRENEIDFIIAVGGGSVIDGTKFIAAAVGYDGDDAWDIVTGAATISSAIPFATVLTLPAAGSEMNSGAVISRQDRPDKLAFMSPFLFPRFSILDPTTTYTLPPNQTANGIVDIFVHVTEQYLTYPVNAPVQDRFSEALLSTLLEEAPKVMREPTNYDARANIMWCSTLALNGLIASGVPSDWATHLLGHELTAKFNLDHGQTLAVVLPALLTVKTPKKRSKLLQYAERVWNLNEGDPEQKIAQAIEKTRDFFEALGIKTHLSDYDIAGKEIPALVKQLEEHGMVALGEHADITLAESQLIYEKCV